MRASSARREAGYVCELKPDGTAVSLRYENGVFARGDARQRAVGETSRVT